MPRNVEIKARAADFVRQMTLAAQVATQGPTVLHQRDTFFGVPHGRLKLRDFGGTGELIQYERPDLAASKTSDYVVVPVGEPEPVRLALSRALGITVEVIKTRTLYLAGCTRIHFDEVEGLGQFIELEVVLREGEDDSAGQAEAADLMARLGIRQEDLVSCAYADLLMRR
jgi:predicted adenylyl cyclase CyaB